MVTFLFFFSSSLVLSLVLFHRWRYGTRAQAQICFGLKNFETYIINNVDLLLKEHLLSVITSSYLNITCAITTRATVVHVIVREQPIAFLIILHHFILCYHGLLFIFLVYNGCYCCTSCNNTPTTPTPTCRSWLLHLHFIILFI